MRYTSDGILLVPRVCLSLRTSTERTQFHGRPVGEDAMAKMFRLARGLY